MKQFEKWAKEKGYDLYRHTNDSWELGISSGVEEGWRGALEWLLSQETTRPLLGHKEHRYVDSIVIRKELKNGD